MRLRNSILVAALLGAPMLAAQPVHGQTFGTTARALCVGAGIGCQQVDFFLEFLGLPGETWLSTFSITATPGWSFVFPGTTEAEDAWGLNFYSPQVVGETLTGFFDFGAVLDPSITSTLRVRAEFAHEPAAFEDASSLFFTYEALSDQGELLGSGAVSATVTPEPLSVVLLGSGLVGLAAARRRRKTKHQS